MDLANLLKYQVLPLLLSQTILAFNSLLANTNYPSFLKKKKKKNKQTRVALQFPSS